MDHSFLEIQSSSIKKKSGDLSCPKKPYTGGGYYFSFSISSSNQSWSSNFIGPVWYHYFGPKKNSLVTIFGLGWESISAYKSFKKSLDRTKEGLGVIAGVGYEMNKGWIIQGRFNYGSSFGGIINSKSLSVLMTKMWY